MRQLSKKKLDPMPTSDPGYRSVVIQKDESYPVHHVWFYSFEEASILTEFMHLVATSPPSSQIIIHLANVGGSVHSGIQLLYHIQKAIDREVRFELHIEAPVYSMAADFTCKLIHLGVRTEFAKHSYVMFHDYASYLHGKGHEIDAMHKADKKLIRNFFIDCCVDVFTVEEVDEILAGKDTYLTREEIIKRVESKRNKKKKKTSKR